MSLKNWNIIPSDKPGKKYYAQKPGEKKKVYFGSTDPGKSGTANQHYRDKIGHWAKLDHGDKQRRDRFLSRFRSCKDRVGTPCWFASRVLWT